MNAIPPAALRHDWTSAEIQGLLSLPFPDLLFRAATIHRAHHDPNRVQISTLLSIKTGGCPEDCAYCPQSAAYEAGVPASKLMDVDAVLAEAQAAKAGRRQPLLHGRRLAQPEGPRPRRGVRHGRRRARARPGKLRHARHAHRPAGATAWPPPASITTTTISIRRRNFTATLSPRGSTRTGSIRWPTCATPASTCAAAASSAWAKQPSIAPA